MATDVTNSVEDVEMAESEEDKVVTMMDVLQEQEDFEEDANAVLGASDDKNCTYSKGYIKRQALYACMTCCSEAKSDPTKRAGLCLACSLICHENHELVELYTKRNFRCDCGNSKFNSHPCKLTPNKASQNEENSYNQNFSGLYCVCQRPYPDSKNMVDDEMIQCTICEDWLHASHLETTVPASDQYTEMICKGCMETHIFLHSYSNLVVNIDNTDVDIINICENDNKKSNICNGDVKTDKTNVKTKENPQSHETEDINRIKGILETSTTEAKTEYKKNIESNINGSDMTYSNDNKECISCEKENLNEPTKDSSDSVMTSDNTKEIASENLELENVENLTDLNPECNKTKNIIEIKKGESHSDNISEQNTSNDQPDVTRKGDNVGNSKEIVDVKVEVATQESDTNCDTVVTVMSLKKETEDANHTTKATISNQNIKDEERMEEDRLLADPESENINDLQHDDSKATHTVENANSGRQIAENESSNNKSEQVIENNTLSLLNNDPEDSTKIEIKVSENPASSNKVTNLESQEVKINELSEENKANDEEAESKAEIHVENIIKATSNEEVQKEFSNTEQSSNSFKESEPNSQDKVTEKRKLSTEESSNNVVVKKTKLEEFNDIQSCICPKTVKKVHKGATFWPSNFRQKLCTCRECLTLYKDLSVLYLIDPEDTVSAYTSLGIENTNGKPSQYEKGLQALASLDRIQQINALTEYNKMRDKLLDFLKSFKDRKEIVKEEDIKAFFAGMKPTREPDGVYFCR